MKNLDPRFEGLSPTIYTQTVPAGKTHEIDLIGTYYYLVESTGVLYVKRSGGDGGSPMPHDQGTGLVGSFTRLEFQNKSAVDVTFTAYIGTDNGYIDNRLNVISSRTPLHQMEQKTEVIARAENSIAAATAIEFSGDFGGDYYYRKGLIVSNEDSALKVHIRDSAGNVALVVYPETTVFFPSSDALDVYNPNGSAVQVRISEMVYIK